MAKPRTPSEPAARREWLAYPTLIVLVAAIVIFGALHYSMLLAVLSAGFVGFFTWLWWYRRQPPVAPPGKTPGRRKASRRSR